MRLQVVGGSGFLGGELVRQSVSAGHDVIATHLTRPGTVDGPDWRRLDIRCRQDVFDLIDDKRCPVHVADLTAALVELAASERSGVHHVAGADVISRYELGLLIAERDGIDPAALPSGRRVDANVAGPIDVRLDSTATQRPAARLRYLARCRGAHGVDGRLRRAGRGPVLTLAPRSSLRTERSWRHRHARHRLPIQQGGVSTREHS